MYGGTSEYRIEPCKRDPCLTLYVLCTFSWAHELFLKYGSLTNYSSQDPRQDLERHDGGRAAELSGHDER